MSAAQGDFSEDSAETARNGLSWELFQWSHENAVNSIEFDARLSVIHRATTNTATESNLLERTLAVR
jgi:hypothetical protein